MEEIWGLLFPASAFGQYGTTSELDTRIEDLSAQQRNDFDAQLNALWAPFTSTPQDASPVSLLPAGPPPRTKICPHCGLETQKLKRHQATACPIATALGPKTMFHCDVPGCLKKYPRSDNLLRHKKDSHNGTRS